jgi:hypothetical protein
MASTSVSVEVHASGSMRQALDGMGINLVEQVS